MYIKSPIYIVKHFPCSHTVSRGKNSLALIGVGIDSLYLLGANKKWVISILNSVLGVFRTSLY